MLYEVDWAEDGTYRPGEFNSPEKFFNDCLENSKEFDLQLGYFSSATISVLADGFASFISNGGKMRLVINHIVSEEDKDAIKAAVKEAKESLEKDGDDKEKLEEAAKKLNDAIMPIGAKMYQQASADAKTEDAKSDENKDDDGSVEGEPEVFLGLAIVAFLLYSGAEVPVVPHGDVVDRHGVGEADDASSFSTGADEVVAEAVVELVVVAGAAGA